MTQITGQRAGQPRIIEGDGLTPVDDESGALINAERAWMVVGAGMDPQPLRLADTPGTVDRRPQQIAAIAAADELGNEAKIGELDIARVAAVELEVTSRDAADIENRDLDLRLLDLRGEALVAPLPTQEPQPRLADRRV